MVIDRATARRRLTNRWLEQVERYPLMREEIPLALYIQRNIHTVMQNGALADYANRG